MVKYFYKVPNSCTDYREIMVRFCMDRHKTLEDVTYISLHQMCNECNYTIDRHKGNFLDYIKSLLTHFIEQGLIVQCCGKPPDKASIYEMLGFVLDEQFSPVDNYVTLSADSFDKLVRIKTSIKREVLMHTYLRVKSYIYDYQPKDEDVDREYGFYGSLSYICEELGYARKTVDACMDLFVEYGIFKKHSTGSLKRPNGTVFNVPNIYVLNDENADRNIYALLDKMKEMYNVSDFLPPTYKNMPLKKRIT